MARYCGGIKHDATLKIINGVLCDAGAASVDVSKAVTTCGQLWDGSLFTKVVQNGKKIITLHSSEGEAVGEAVPVNGNCGVCLDGRFFKVADGVVSLQVTVSKDGYTTQTQTVSNNSDQTITIELVNA